MEKKNQPEAFSSIHKIAWEKLSKKKIYFGHQSVGFNIFDGINMLMKDNPNIKLNIIETKNLSDDKEGIFAHSPYSTDAILRAKYSSMYEV